MWTPESDPNILFEFSCEFTDIFEFVVVRGLIFLRNFIQMGVRFPANLFRGVLYLAALNMIRQNLTFLLMLFKIWK
jgi:hypothetical protein